MSKIQRQTYTDDDIAVVWSDVWNQEIDTPIKKQFSRLFVEGYRVYRQYIPHGKCAILEVGAGSGRYGIAIARDYPHAELTISDPLVESTTLIKKAVEDLKLPNASVREENCLHLSFPDNSFDLVFGDVVIQHIIDVDVAMKEMKRVLKPGGLLVLSVVNTHNPFHSLYKWLLKLQDREYEYGYERTYTKKELRILFSQSGLIDTGGDGFFMAYGMYRWGYTYPFFKLTARIINRFVTYIDKISRRIISRHWGFIIIAVGTKSVHN